MKQRTLILFVTFLLVSVAGIAQTDSYDGRHPIIVDENEVRSITVNGNIDVILQRSRTAADVSIKMDKEFSGKVRVKLADGDLYISSVGKASGTERKTVYLWANGLETITLKGNSFITSIGVLQLDNLTVNLKDDARIAIKSTGKINVNTQKNKPVTEEQQYFTVYSAQL